MIIVDMHIAVLSGTAIAADSCPGTFRSSLLAQMEYLLRSTFVLKRLKLRLSGSARKSRKRFRHTPKFRFLAIFYRIEPFQRSNESAQNGTTTQFESGILILNGAGMGQAVGLLSQGARSRQQLSEQRLLQLQPAWSELSGRDGWWWARRG